MKWTPVVDYEVIREMLYVYTERHDWKHMGSESVPMMSLRTAHLTQRRERNRNVEGRFLLNILVLFSVSCLPLSLKTGTLRTASGSGPVMSSLRSCLNPLLG